MQVFGEYERCGEYNCFIPFPLPPSPPLALSSEQKGLAESVNELLDQLNKKVSYLPSYLQKAFLVKEALSSCAVTGIVCSMVDILRDSYCLSQEAMGKDVKDNHRYVLNYVKTLESFNNLDNATWSPSYILELHQQLIGIDGAKRSVHSGYRQQNVCIEGFIPAPHEKMVSLISALVNFVNQEVNLELKGLSIDAQSLLKVGLVQAQLNQLYPFETANGRLSRILAMKLFMQTSLISTPCLYISAYYKKYLAQYTKMIHQADHSDWLSFFLNAVQESAKEGIQLAQELMKLDHDIRENLLEPIEDPEFAQLTLDYLQRLYQNPYANIQGLNDDEILTYNRMKDLGYVIICDDSVSGRFYRFETYLYLLR